MQLKISSNQLNSTFVSLIIQKSTIGYNSPEKVFMSMVDVHIAIAKVTVCKFLASLPVCYAKL